MTTTDPKPRNLRRAELSARLRLRHAEIEQATLAYIDQEKGAQALGDPAYAEGVREATAAALSLGFEAIEHGEQDPEIPAALLDQARLAAQNGVPLETVVKRYVAGYTLLGNFVMEETEEGDLLTSAELRCIRELQTAVFNRVVDEVSAEYSREKGARAGNGERSRIEQVKRLLAEEVIDTSSLEYDFDLVHVGLIAHGRDAGAAIRHLARSLDRRLLVVRMTDQTHWAWLGGATAQNHTALKLAVRQSWPSELPLALGDQGRGIDGWRLTHRQASAALKVVMHAEARQVHYAEEALLVSILENDLLETSLRKIYLEPLSRDQDGGKALYETLRAYFDAGKTVSSAAAALKVSRQTVGNRLRTIEERLGRPVGSCGTELDAALRLKKLDHQS